MTIGVDLSMKNSRNLLVFHEITFLPSAFLTLFELRLFWSLGNRIFDCTNIEKRLKRTRDEDKSVLRFIELLMFSYLKSIDDQRSVFPTFSGGFNLNHSSELDDDKLPEFIDLSVEHLISFIARS